LEGGHDGTGSEPIQARETCGIATAAAPVAPAASRNLRRDVDLEGFVCLGVIGMPPSMKNVATAFCTASLR
jgi:hypothetical protein